MLSDRELDALVEQHIFKRFMHWRAGEPYVAVDHHILEEVPHYSSDTEDTEKLIDKIVKDGWTLYRDRLLHYVILYKKRKDGPRIKIEDIEGESDDMQKTP